MPVSSSHARRRRPSASTLLVGALILGGLAWLVRAHAPHAGARSTGGTAPAPCAADQPCSTPAADGSRGSPIPALPVVHAQSMCADAGYLCAGLDSSDHVLVQHWTGFTGTVVVHVPPPPESDALDSQRLQRAAEAGIRAWNGHPFPILVDERGSRPATFAVTWVRSLGGKRIGLANTRWSRAGGLEVVSIQLVTRNPVDPDQLLDPRQVQLTAAHEMGHALGLPHSDSEHDVMYPTNTATALSARDYRTMEALYSLENGTRIVR